MNSIERLLRLMTHLNIGAMLGMAAWVVWSGALIVGGDIRPRSVNREDAAKPACCLVQAGLAESTTRQARRAAS